MATIFDLVAASLALAAGAAVNSITANGITATAVAGRVPTFETSNFATGAVRFGGTGAAGKVLSFGTGTALSTAFKTGSYSLTFVLSHPNSGTNAQCQTILSQQSAPGGIGQAWYGLARPTSAPDWAYVTSQSAEGNWRGAIFRCFSMFSVFRFPF